MAQVPSNSKSSSELRHIQFRVSSTRNYLVPGPAKQPCEHAYEYQPFRTRIDGRQIKHWLSFCKEFHTDCARSADDALPELLVIDCLEQKVVAAPENCQYVALSYLWGKSSEEPNLRSLEMALQTGSVPQTVKDAATVVKRLGLRFLWVDRYCIEQADPSMKHNLISKMDMVYQGAALTIIVAAGNGPEYGLPGVSRDFPQYRSTTMRDRCKLIRLPDPTLEIRQSKWSSRGWTYQEGLFSRRRLVFTETQVYFQCLSMHCLENWQVSLEELHLPSRRRLRDGVTRFQHFPKNGLGTEPRHILQRINEYSVRSLTFSSDSLNAFLGIFRAYEKMNPPVHHFWGMPVFHDDLQLMASSSSVSFVSALLWGGWMSGTEARTSTSLTRVPDLPSWSWAGWVGYSEERKVLPFPSPKFLSDLRLDVSIALARADTVKLETQSFSIPVLLGSLVLDTGATLQAAHSKSEAGEIDFATHRKGRIPVSPCVVISGWTTTVRWKYSPERDVFTLDEAEPSTKAKDSWLTLDGVLNDELERRLVKDSWEVLIMSWSPVWGKGTCIGLLLNDYRQPICYTRIGVVRTTWSNRPFKLANKGDRWIRMAGRLFVYRRICLF